MPSPTRASPRPRVVADRHPQHRRCRLRGGLHDHGHRVRPGHRPDASLSLARPALRAALRRGLRPGNGREHEPRHRPRLGRLHQAQRHHRQRPGAAQRLHVTGPWHLATQQWPATPAPGCGWTYSAQTHPASPAPVGTMLVSWASNYDDPGTTCDMQPQFTDLPIDTPPPRTDGSGCDPATGGDNRFPLRPWTGTIMPGVSSSEREGGAVDVRPDSRAFRRPLTPGGRRHLPRGEMP